mgnify:CR=1 FL=1
MNEISQIFMKPAMKDSVHGLPPKARRLADIKIQIEQRLREAPHLELRFRTLEAIGKSVRSSEYHITNACNLRCEGCWFFDLEHDKETKDQANLESLARFVDTERNQRGINTALIIGGEPTLFLNRLRVFVGKMDNVTISTNGLKKLPYEGFERVAIGITVFGGEKLDDELRAIRPNGTRFSGLFDTALRNYYQDKRAGFVYALTHEGIDSTEETVKKIHSNGNKVTFNYYTSAKSDQEKNSSKIQELLDEALRVKSLYPRTVVSHHAFISALITGRSLLGEFGYHNCPSISTCHPAHEARLQNGNPVLPRFNAWSADTKTLKFCCTSGHCDSCRDSQAIYSWLVVNMPRFLENEKDFLMWIEVAESYWSQFIWFSDHVVNRVESA